MMSFRDIRLREDLKRLEALLEQSTMLSFTANFEERDPPDEYVLTYRCGGLAGPEQLINEHHVHIYLSAEYPRRPPIVRFISQIFHPNIIAPINSGNVRNYYDNLLAQARDDQQRELIFQDMRRNDVFRGQVCLDTLKLNWSPMINLDVVCLEIGEMIQYKRYNVDDPLNIDAAEWVQHHQDQLPVDNRTLLDVKALDEIQIYPYDEQDQSDDTLDIRILL